MKYEVTLSRSARKFLKQLGDSDKKRVLAALELISENPRPPKAKKLVARNAYRVRVGAIRIIYEVFDEMVSVLVPRIGKRDQIYKEMQLPGACANYQSNQNLEIHPVIPIVLG